MTGRDRIRAMLAAVPDEHLTMEPRHASDGSGRTTGVVFIGCGCSGEVAAEADTVDRARLIAHARTDLAALLAVADAAAEACDCRIAYQQEYHHPERCRVGAALAALDGGAS